MHHQTEPASCCSLEKWRVPASLRFAGNIAFVIWIAFTPQGAWGRYATAAAILIVYGTIAKVSFRRLFKAFLYFEAFVVGIACLSLFQQDGVSVFFSLIARSSLCVFCMTLLSCTTSFSELLNVSRCFQFPPLLSITLALTYRYSFLLMEEAERLRRARRSRTFSASRFELWKLLASDIAQLYIRSSKRGERVYAAMCARGWQT